MSKYKVGDKIVLIGEIDGIRYDERTGYYRYSIDLPNECDSVYDVHEDRLRSYESFVEQNRKQFYEDGLSDAWEAARMIHENPDRIRKIFDNPFIDDILNSHAPQAIVAKIKEWEDSKEIKRGDEVMSKGTHEKGIITAISKDKCFIVWGDGSSGYRVECAITKTGRNFAAQLDALLGEIGGDTNG